MRSRLLPILVISLAVTFLAPLLMDASADAQRRRRQRQQRPQPTEQTPPAEEAPAEGEDAEAEGAGDEGVDAADATEGEEPEAAPQDGQTAQDPQEQGYDAYAPIGPDLGPLREDYTSIMDELVNVRSRMAVLGRQLFQTKIRIVVQNRAGDGNTLSRLVVSVDGAPVHRGSGSDLGDDGKQVFEGFAAPGPHVLTLEAEQRQRADDDYRYTLRESFRFTVVRERLTEVTLVLDDDSDMGEDFEDDGEAEYEVTTRMRVATRELRD